MPRIIFVTHTDVVVDENIPPLQWQLSEQGQIRMAQFANHPVLRNVTNIITSAEPKAAAGGKIGAVGVRVCVRVPRGVGHPCEGSGMKRSR